MANGSLTKKRINGHAYYYLRFTQRVNGTPKVVRQVYLGKVEDIAAAMAAHKQGQKPKRIVLADFGAVAALWAFIEKTGLIALIDAQVPKRAQGPSVGHYLAIALVNRAVSPTSKSQIGRWFAKTILPRLTGISPQALTPQRFWDQMEKVTPAAIEAIEAALAQRLVDQFGLDLTSLAFDATNFFTFISTRNTRTELAQRGHNKNGRHDLRQISLALLVSTDFHVPLFHHTYDGNRHDAVEFRCALATLRARQEAFTKHCQDITLVFDKGNNSTVGFDLVEETAYHFVGSLCPTQHPDLLAIAPEHFTPLTAPRLEQVSVYRTQKQVFGKVYTILVTFNDNLYTAQLTTLTEQMAKCRTQLTDLQRRLLQHRHGKLKGTKKPTLTGTQNRVKALTKARHLKDIFQVTIAESPAGITLTYRVQAPVIAHLCSTLFGKTLLFTDQEEWPAEDIVYAYRGQYRVEDCFRQMKHPHFVTFSPVFHWTDQKIRVHAFYCVLALTMVSLLQRDLAGHGIELSIPEALATLGEIKEVALFYNRSAQTPVVQTMLSELDDRQTQLFNALGLQHYLQP